jgi:HAD superfamily hydrolase (TIGR01509 family)
LPNSFYTLSIFDRQHNSKYHAASILVSPVSQDGTFAAKLAIDFISALFPLHFLMIRTSHIQAVVFDLDGLMFNTEELYDQVMVELCRRRNLQFTDDLRMNMMGRPGEKAFDVMIAHFNMQGENSTLMLQESDALFHKLLEVQLAPMHGLFELLSALETAQLPKGIGTSSRRKYVDYVLGRYTLTERFQFILSAENVVQGKPHPEIYLKAAEQHGVAPENMLVLEDSQNGCRAAIASGAFAVAVPGNHSRSHNFQGAALVIDSLADARLYQALGIPY